MYNNVLCVRYIKFMDACNGKIDLDDNPDFRRFWVENLGLKTSKICLAIVNAALNIIGDFLKGEVFLNL